MQINDIIELHDALFGTPDAQSRQARRLVGDSFVSKACGKLVAASVAPMSFEFAGDAITVNESRLTYPFKLDEFRRETSR